MDCLLNPVTLQYVKNVTMQNQRIIVKYLMTKYFYYIYIYIILNYINVSKLVVIKDKEQNFVWYFFVLFSYYCSFVALIFDCMASVKVLK